MKISIIVPIREEVEFITMFIDYLLGQNLNNECEIIVVDGLSSDGTREEISNYKSRIKNIHLRFKDNPKQIVSSALNIGIKEARGDIIIRMDVHTEYAEDYVQKCVEILERTGADNVGGPARTKAKTYVQRAVAAAYHSPFSVGGARFHDEDYEGYVDTVTYGCWRKETLEKLGGFDEELVRNQDDELNLRIIRNGGKIYQSPEIRSWYYPRSSLRALFKQYFQYGYWKVRVIQKHKLPASWRHLVPGAFVLYIIQLPITYNLLPITSYLLFFYLLLDLFFSFLSASKHNWKLLPILPIIFFVYHFSYGLGFLIGIVDFLILRKHKKGKGVSTIFQSLSR